MIKLIESSLEANLGELLQGKSILGHSAGDKRKVAIVSMDPVKQNHTLNIRANAYGNKMYSLIMQILMVDYATDVDDAHPLEVNFKDMTKGYMPQIDNSTRVQVRCTCPDFYYTWSYYDFKSKSLAGPKMPAYVRKTQTRPERNPAHVPGACKHIIELANRLAGLGIYKLPGKY